MQMKHHMDISNGGPSKEQKTIPELFAGSTFLSSSGINEKNNSNEGK